MSRLRAHFGVPREDTQFKPLPPNPYTISADGKTITLFVASPKYGTLPVVIDAEDYHKIQHLHWSARKPKYTFYFHARQKKRTFVLHRLVADAAPSAQIDHRDGNGLDCRKSNLRLATNQANQRNTRIKKKQSQPL